MKLSVETQIITFFNREEKGLLEWPENVVWPSVL